MTDLLINAVKRHVASMIGKVGQTRVGVITSVNASNYTARVMIQPENVQSGWLPIAATMVGGGWGLVSPPTNGEQVVILPQEGDSEHGIIVGRLFSNKQRPPKTYTDQTKKSDTSHVQPGEIGLIHASGTFLRLMDGKVVVHGNVFVDGDMTVTGNITSAKDVADAHGTLDRLRGNYDAHQHGNSPLTSRPDPE